jgi:phage FluMu protein Com
MSGFSGIRKTVSSPPNNEQVRIDKLVAELKSRGVLTDACARCRTFDWSVDFFQMPVAHEGFISPFGQGVSGYLPVACFTCKNCGYLVYHNLKVIETSK